MQVIFGICPQCQRKFSFIIPDHIQALKPIPGEITYRYEMANNNLQQLAIHYYIYGNSCGIVLKEMDTQHYMIIIVNPRNWKTERIYSINNNVFIKYFSDLFNTDVKEEHIEKLLDCLIIDDFNDRIQLEPVVA